METLLQPAKLLAEWDFNFSQNLERYFEALKNLQSVNFGEAALVVQNSVNVYSRRVHNLWEDTESLGQSLVAQNDEGEKEDKMNKKCINKSRTVIDFNDFESLKLDDYVGKSNNLKEDGQKTLKLLTRRFTQLESSLAQLSSPIEILNIRGEVIGNKYDFRCNQQLTKDCMLVDELLPDDFSERLTPEVLEHQTTNNVTSIVYQDSGFYSIIEQNELQQAATPESINSVYMETTNVDDYVSASDFDQSLNIPHETEASSTFNDVDENIEPTLSSSTTKPETEPIKKKQTLEPIPFENGVPDTIPKRRTQFKLPCHISLLKTKAESRKRKTMSESKKRAYLTRCLLDNYELVHKKLKIYSPTKQLYQLKREELEEFIDQYIKSMRDTKTCNYEAITSDATMELLGFQRRLTKEDPVVENHISAKENHAVNPTTIIEPESDLSSVPESFTTPPPTPEANSQLNYRELVEQRMRQIGDETFEQTDLEQRVADWHKSLRSKLTTAGRRPPFDIHEYGSQIIKSLEVAGSKTVPFSNLVKNQSPPEIARYFLASLQLANTYDISINSSADFGRCIELTLLEQGRRLEPP